jgi:hypothetical protein
VNGLALLVHSAEAEIAGLESRQERLPTRFRSMEQGLLVGGSKLPHAEAWQGGNVPCGRSRTLRLDEVPHKERHAPHLDQSMGEASKQEADKGGGAQLTQQEACPPASTGYSPERSIGLAD